MLGKSPSRGDRGPRENQIVLDKDETKAMRQGRLAVCRAAPREGRALLTRPSLHLPRHRPPTPTPSRADSLTLHTDCMEDFSISCRRTREAIGGEGCLLARQDNVAPPPCRLDATKGGGPPGSFPALLFSRVESSLQRGGEANWVKCVEGYPVPWESDVSFLGTLDGIEGSNPLSAALSLSAGDLSWG